MSAVVPAKAGARRVASHEQKPFALCHAAPDDLPEPTVC